MVQWGARDRGRDVGYRARLRVLTAVLRSMIVGQTRDEYCQHALSPRLQSPFTTDAPKRLLHNTGRLFADAKCFALRISVSVRRDVQVAHGLYEHQATDTP